MRTKAVLKEGFQSVIDNGRSHSFITDLPENLKGCDAGATALEVCLMSFAGCVSTIYKMVAEKMRLQVDELEVNMSGSKGTETIDKVELEVLVKSPESIEKLQRCLEQTEKSCPVGVLFRNAGVKIETKLVQA